MKFSLPSFALKRPITVIMLLLTFLGLGAIAWTRIPVEFIPKLDVPFIGCYIPYPGATPAQVEKEVAIPAEGEFRTISGLKRIITTSDSNGCNVRLNFDWDTDMALATAEVRDRMERLKLVLPPEIDRLWLRRFSSATMPIMMFSLFTDGDQEELTYRARTVLAPRLQRVDGIAEVVVMGLNMPGVSVEFDQDALRTHNLDLYQLISSLQSSSVNVSVGQLLDGQTRHYVRVQDEFTSPAEIGELVVGPNGLRLKEIAEVGYSRDEVKWKYSLDGKDGVFIFLRKESEANAVAACRAVKLELDQALKETTFSNTELFVFFDQSELIMSSLNSLMDAGKYGSGLALIILFLFMRKVRPTLVCALTIPGSLVAALVVMFFTGITLNIITMISMIIAIGMLVDNAIVVTENVFRYRQLGFEPMESARRGASEVGLAITASTITTMVVFAPMFYIETGDMASYLRQFAIPVTVSLAGSLILALTIIPLAASRMKSSKRGKEDGENEGSRKKTGNSFLSGVIYHIKQQHVLLKTISAYTWLLALTQRRRFETFLLVAAVAIVSYYIPFKKVGTQEMPTLDTREVDVGVNLEQNFDLEMIEETFDNLLAVVEPLRDELDIKNLFYDYSLGGGSIRVILTPPEEYPPGERPKYSTEDVLNILWEKLPSRIPGGRLRFSIAEAGEGGSRNISIIMRGDDADTLDKYAEQFAMAMETLPDISDVDTDTELPKQEMRLDVDEALAGRAGISPMVVAQTVDFALRGVRLQYMKQQGREVPVMAQLKESDRETKEDLENVAVVGATGRMIPIRELATLTKARTSRFIRRVNAKNVINITAKTDSEDLALVSANIKRLRDSFALAPGYSIELGDELLDLETNAANFMIMLALAIILIYIVIGALFESCILPLSVLTSVPLAFMGVYWMMYLTKTSMDTIAYIVCILLVGVIVNNGIVIVDHINLLRKEGKERHKAIIQAGKDRFRPVMMTAMTTIFGCVPLALGGASSDAIAFHSMGRALIGGLAVGTLLTLFVVPLSYSVFDDIRIWFTSFLGDLAGLSRTSRKPKPADNVDFT